MIESNKKPFDYQLRRSRRATRARIIVTPNKIEVVAPQRMTDAAVHGFVHDNRDWVGKTVKRIERKLQQHVPLAPTVYANGAMIPYRGSRWPLTVKVSKLKRVKIEFAEAFIAHVPQSAQSVADFHTFIKEALGKWMQNCALQTARAVADQHQQRFGLIPRSIRVRKQKTRWGSCGIHNDININWLLILTPPEILEYVMVHELCHIRYRNHSSDFWSLVEAHMPDYRQHRKWLRDNGAGLMMGL